MKIILNNTDIEFRTLRAWKSYTMTWCDANSSTGNVSAVETQGQYSRVGVGEFISTENDGKSVSIALSALTEMYVYVYDTNKTFLGYGKLGTGDFPATTIFADIISAIPDYKIGSTAQNRDAVIAAAKYYKVVFGNNISLSDQFKVR